MELMGALEDEISVMEKTLEELRGASGSLSDTLTRAADLVSPGGGHADPC